MSFKDASLRISGLRSLFHFPVNIFVGVDPVRTGSKWKRRANCVSAKLVPNQLFFSNFIQRSVLTKAVIQS